MCTRVVIHTNFYIFCLRPSFHSLFYAVSWIHSFINCSGIIQLLTHISFYLIIQWLLTNAFLRIPIHAFYYLLIFLASIHTCFFFTPTNLPFFYISYICVFISLSMCLFIHLCSLLVLLFFLLMIASNCSFIYNSCSQALIVHNQKF